VHRPVVRSTGVDSAAGLKFQYSFTSGQTALAAVFGHCSGNTAGIEQRGRYASSSGVGWDASGKSPGSIATGGVRAVAVVTTIAIIGVDCAAQAKNTGLAYAIPEGEKLAVHDARCASNDATASSIIRDWVRDSRHVLLALDAPLGWPTAFSHALATHRAGEPLRPTAHVMFRRMTDDLISERLGKRPLEVAADRIARAAHAALRLLEELRQSLAVELPLVWSPSWHGGLGAIEVYPAATRIALGVPQSRGSLSGLESRLSFGTMSPPASEHARDAVVCAVAAQEFLSGRAVAPTNAQMIQARQEGWIWAGPSSAQRALCLPAKCHPPAKPGTYLRFL